MTRSPHRRREDRILAVLAEHPHGLLTHFLAQKLGYPKERQMRGDLRRLHRAGHIESYEIRNWNAAMPSQWSWALVDTKEGQ